jgi:hypothetical protein
LDSNTGVLTKIRRPRLLDRDQDETDRDRSLQGPPDRLDAFDCIRRVAEVPPIDWSHPPERIKSAPLAIWQSMQLDKQMRPARAEWLVVEWHA